MCKRKHTLQNVTTKTARKKTHAKRDTLIYARDIFQEIAGLKIIVHSSIQAKLL